MQDLSRRHRVWLSDVWGVVHDGHKPIAPAVSALQRHRAGGGTVILITNAPRPKAVVQAQLDHIGITRDAYDDMVTSGDVTLALMQDYAGRGLHHIGPEEDLTLFEGLNIPLLPLERAGAVICTGFHDERHETAQDYVPVLQDMKARGLAMICANPDKVVRKGPLLIPCAGAIAEVYEQMGGTVLMAGKPYAPIDDLALARASDPARGDVLAIGDGPETDINGAARQGLACLFISGGINTEADAEAKVRAQFPKAKIAGAMPELYWP